MADDDRKAGSFGFGKGMPRFGAQAGTPKAAAAIVREPALIIALDVPSVDEANRCLALLQDLPVWFKVGLELFTAEGPSLIQSLGLRKFPVFLDLKFHDIPNTVRSAVKSAVRLKVAMTTLHLSGGEAMARAAVSGREEALAEMREMRNTAKFNSRPDDRQGTLSEADAIRAAAGVPLSGMVGQAAAAVVVAAKNASGSGERRTASRENNASSFLPHVPVAYAGRPLPLLMGVTVLTSDAGKGRDGVRDLVVQRAAQAREWGLDGVICSGREVAAVKAACGKDFLCVCPGVRFSGEAGGDDQARVVTPEAAVQDGADFLVMGRPVLRAEDPKAAAVRALLLMQGRQQRESGR